MLTTVTCFSYKMAGVPEELETELEYLEEYDEATPLRSSYCGRLSEAQYEEQASMSTEKALKDLIDHLQENPEQYRKVVRRKKREEAEEAGLMSYVKVKLFSLWSGEDCGYATPTKEECDEKLGELKQDMMKVYNYSQQGRRRSSARLAKKRMKANNMSSSPSIVAPPPPPPPAPPPPPPPPPVATGCSPLRKQSRQRSTHLPSPLTRRSLHSTQDSAARTRTKLSLACNHHDDLVMQLRGSSLRKRLKRTDENRSPGGTPAGGWSKGKKHQPDLLPYFNTKLIEKFKNVRSPTPGSPVSPSVCESPS